VNNDPFALFPHAEEGINDFIENIVCREDSDDLAPSTTGRLPTRLCCAMATNFSIAVPGEIVRTSVFMISFAVGFGMR
jgi:hypothetical protein